MDLQCVCQRCGDARPLSDVILAAIDDAAFSQAIQAAAQLPPSLADSVIRYMRLYGNLRPATYAKVLTDLVNAINGGKFLYKRTEHKASPALWLAALTDTLASSTIKLPLKAANGHNYLFSIAADKAGRSTASQADQPIQADSITPAPKQADPERTKLLGDIRHWEAQLKLRPNDPTIESILADLRAKLTPS